MLEVYLVVNNMKRLSLVCVQCVCESVSVPLCECVCLYVCVFVWVCHFHKPTSEDSSVSLKSTAGQISSNDFMHHTDTVPSSKHPLPSSFTHRNTHKHTHTHPASPTQSQGLQPIWLVTLAANFHTLVVLLLLARWAPGSQKVNRIRSVTIWPLRRLAVLRVILFVLSDGRGWQYRSHCSRRAQVREKLRLWNTIACQSEGGGGREKGITSLLSSDVNSRTHDFFQPHNALLDLSWVDVPTQCFLQATYCSVHLNTHSNILFSMPGNYIYIFHLIHLALSKGTAEHQGFMSNTGRF